MSTNRVACKNTIHFDEVPSIADLEYANRETARRRAEYFAAKEYSDSLWEVYEERNTAHSRFVDLAERVGARPYGKGEARAIKDVLWAERNAAVLDWKYAVNITMSALGRVTVARERADAIYEGIVA